MSAPELLVMPAFASPIVTSELPNSLELNRELRAFFLECESGGLKFRKKKKTTTLQVNIFESEFDLFEWDVACIRRLKLFCADMLTHTVQQLSGFSSEEQRRFRITWESWFHITREGGYISSHTHPNASWSGIYCVWPGEVSPSRPDSGVLRFLDARPQANMYLDIGNAALRRPYNSGSVNYRLRAGQLVLFPSYLVHETGPFFGSDDRITVAFNCRFSEISAARI